MSWLYSVAWAEFLPCLPLLLILQNKRWVFGWWGFVVFQAGHCRGDHYLESSPLSKFVFHWGIIFIVYCIWRMNYVFLLFHLVSDGECILHLNLFCLLEHTLWLKGCLNENKCVLGTFLTGCLLPSNLFPASSMWLAPIQWWVSVSCNNPARARPKLVSAPVLSFHLSLGRCEFKSWLQSSNILCI